MIGQEELHSITSAFELGTLKQFSELPGGYANKNFKVTTAKGAYCVRWCLQQPMDLLTYEVKLMKLLKTNQFPTAFPIPMNDGEFILVQDDQQIMVYEFKEGLEPVPNERTALEMGQAVGRLSGIVAEDHLASKQNTLDPSHMRDLIDYFPKADNPIAEIFEFIEDYYDKFYLLEAVNLPRGIIHGDMFPNNTLFDPNDRLVAIIDFEEACVDRLLLDVGMTMNGFCFVENQLSPQLADVFLEGYEAHRPLMDIEKMLLLKFIMLSAFSMIGWHMRYHLVDVPHATQELRVRELMARIQHLDEKYSFYEKNIAALNNAIA